jgi:hypothetical protein
LEPSVSSSDYLVWICFPDERFGFVGIVLLDEAIDCGLQIDKRVEYAMLEPASGQFGEETLNRVQPRA